MEPPLPPPPPPPPPPNLAAPPPPPPIPVASSEEREALGAAVATLEKGRCLETEMEATGMMAASLLRHAPANSEVAVDVSSLPGGVRDAWMIVSDASVKKTDSDDPVQAASTALAISAGIIDAAKNDHDLPLGRGQLGRAVHMASLATCLQRESALVQQVEERKANEGATLKRALQAAKARPNYEAVWLQVFDERLQQIQSYHARHELREERAVHKRQKIGNPATDGYDLASTMAETINPLQQGVLFNEEEVMGKYLHLKPIFDASVGLFRKLAGVPEEEVFALSDFVAFLAKGSLSRTAAEADKIKDRKHYVRFLSALQIYLDGFIKRVSPLLKMEEVIQPAIDDFVKDWKSKGGVDGWEAKPAEAAMVVDISPAVDGAATEEPSQGMHLSPYASASDLEKDVDGDKLKAELARLGMKCGGTAADRAKRLFMTKDTPLDELPKKLFAKKKTNDAASGGAPFASKSESRVDIARREAVVMAILDYLRPTLEATLRRLERRQAQTSKERDQELEEELHGSTIEVESKPKAEGDEDDSDDEDDAPIYNPKGVPLGWDGKPIPYWLFKLHGLNHFYPCEICGNESYRGRRNFEMHFTESKHAYGMKCLGIPNTKHFHGVTKIEDAQVLWTQLQGDMQEDKFKEEEYEDSHGNVLSRAAYEDLARQGLL